MKILIVASKFPPEYSGPGVRIPRLYKAIANDIAAKDISVLCGSIEYPENKIYEHEGLKVTRVVPSWIRRRKFPFNIIPRGLFDIIAYFADNIVALRALKNFKSVDMVHILGTSGVTAAALLWAKQNNIPVFQELVTAKASPCQRFFLFWKTCPPENSVIVTMRNDVRARCEKAGYAAQIWHRPNPFNQEMFFPVSPVEKMELRCRLTPFGPDDIVLSSIAKIIPQKNQIFLLAVLEQLDDRFKLVIAGPKVEQGPLYERDRAYLQSIRDRIASLGLQSRVHLITDYVESHVYMKASDLYMLPAYDEGFGTPMMEAIACGVPVIANADEACFAEWLEDGENGYLRSLKVKDWAEACRRGAGVGPEKGLEEAKKIVNLAGQPPIYNQYIEKIRFLTRT